MSTQTLTQPIFTATENPALEFRDGQFLLRSRNVEGGHVERFISNEAVKEAFSGIPIDSGWLRPEIARWGNGKVGEWAVAFIPPGVHEIELQREAVGSRQEVDGGTNKPPDETIEANPGTNAPPDVTIAFDRVTVPLPGLVFFGLGTQYFIWAVRTPRLDPYQEVYRCPLPNIYQDGKVCWGMVKPQRATARTLFEAFDLFMKSTFNNHLAAGRSKKHRDDVRVMLRELAADLKADQRFDPNDNLPGAGYPVSDLVRQVEHKGATLDQAIRNYFEAGEMPE